MPWAYTVPLPEPLTANAAEVGSSKSRLLVDFEGLPSIVDGKACAVRSRVTRVIQRKILALLREHFISKSIETLFVRMCGTCVDLVY